MGFTGFCWCVEDESTPGHGQEIMTDTSHLNGRVSKLQQVRHAGNWESGENPFFPITPTARKFVLFHPPVQHPAAFIITDAQKQAGPLPAETSLCLFPSVNHISSP